MPNQSFCMQRQSENLSNKLIIMPKAHDQAKNMNENNPQKVKCLKPVPSKLIDFTPHSQGQQNKNRLSIQTHHLNKKINKKLRLSFIPNYKNNSSVSRAGKNNNQIFREEIQLDNDISKQQIFSVQKIFKDFNVKLTHYRHNDTDPTVSSHRKIFNCQQAYQKKLKIKNKLSGTKLINYSLPYKNTQPLERMNDFNQTPKPEASKQNNFQSNTFKQPISNRSKTMHIETQNYHENSLSYSRKKRNLQLSEDKLNQYFNNKNKYYEKFQNVCKLTQNFLSRNNRNLLIAANINPHQNTENQPAKKLSYQSSKITHFNRAYKSEPRKKIIKQPLEKLKQTIKNQINLSQESQNRSNLIGQSKSQIKIMIKSNSNNKGFNRQKIICAQRRINFSDSQKSRRDLKRRFMNFKAQESNSNHTLKLINLTSYEENNNKGEIPSAKFCWRDQRIHSPSTEKIQMKINESKKITAKKSRYLNFQRNMKLGNNIHIVITENNKTKINIFHNSLLLKQDPQKADALAALVRDASQLGQHQNKIEIPLQLGINKLKIEEKNNQLSGRQSKKNIQSQLSQGIKKEKEKRKQPVPRARTQKKYPIVLQDVKPWEISDRRDLHQSYQTIFNDRQFTYINSKTIY